ncbi:hypothetical protein [Pseudomonas sp. GD03766]|uniref:hypothetical protein n=1 Tax=Pseudomonas sp. GD03766 TaxID=2975379 RepID=UPI002446CE49|nr:hypothetical protein [Pseudomonas sp. GD03766]MDH1692550.1 hypothetical protein [Pseudomonas sp. GD03766]
MEDLELLSRLEGHQAFGVSMVQRISGFGYQRALDTIARLEAEGAILRDDASSQWMLDNTRARLHALYHTHKSTVRELEDFPRAGVEPLILMDVPKGWSKATNRVLIVGQETLATAWTDFTSTGDYRVAMSLCWEWMSDFTQIRIGEGFRKLRPVDLIARNICARDFLTTELAKDFGGKTVVVTHHCPIEEVAGDGHECSGQLIPDTVLSFSSAFAGASPSLN